MLYFNENDVEKYKPKNKKETIAYISKKLSNTLASVEKLKGGLADSKNVEAIAAHHNVKPMEIVGQLLQGIKIEFEHTNNKEEAEEIAKDHLLEDAQYYTKLAKIEQSSKDATIVKVSFKEKSGTQTTTFPSIEDFKLWAKALIEDYNSEVDSDEQIRFNNSFASLANEIARFGYHTETFEE